MSQLAQPETRTGSSRTPSSLERVEAPTREEFFARYVDRRKPVILTGVASRWPAIEKWTPEYLERVAGDAVCDVHYDEDGDFQRWYGGGETDLKMPLREFLEILQREPADRRYYMTEHAVRRISPALLADVDMSRYRDDGEPFMFLGRDTMMPLHYHGTTEAMLCQLVGTKEVVLYGPEQSSKLHAYPWYSRHWHFSQVSAHEQADKFHDRSHIEMPGAAREAGRYPRFGSAEPIVLTLHPGEILFIPVHWWHLTTCPGYQVNVTWFWRSSVKRYRFPTPGLQVLAHELLTNVRRRLRR